MEQTNIEKIDEQVYNMRLGEVFPKEMLIDIRNRAIRRLEEEEKGIL